MKLAVLSRNPRLYSTRRLVAAGRAAGHVMRVLDPLRCYMSVGHGRLDLHYRGQPLRGLDGVIPRIGPSVAFYGSAVLRQMEMMGVACLNGSDAVLKARDKLRSLQLLAEAGLDLPLTVFGDNPDDTDDLLDMLGAPPHVVKLNEGSQGQGVILTEKPAASRSVIEAFRGLYANFLVQEFVTESAGSDLRCLVVGKRVIATIERSAADGDFRANLHRGGSARATTPEAEERRLALRAARVLGLGVAGVDLLRSKRGPLLLEVNSSPGLEGIEQATGVDVARAMIDATAELAAAGHKRAERP